MACQQTLPRSLPGIMLPNDHATEYDMGATEEITRTIELEGGLSNHPIDTGGLTKYGISRAAYPGVDILNLTLDQAIQIYRRDYYERLGCHRISSARLRWKLFDIGVNCGVGAAAKMLQRILGTQQDGIIGKETLALANSADDRVLCKRLEQEQMKHYATIVMKRPDQSVFLLGWVNRAFATYEEA